MPGLQPQHWLPLRSVLNLWSQYARLFTNLHYWQNKQLTSTTLAVADASHLTSFLHGGLTKLKSTESNLNNTTIAMLARRNGWRLSIDYGVKTMFHLTEGTMPSTIA